MTMLERIRAWDAVQSADREIVADAGLPHEVREAGALSRYAWQAGELTGIVEPDGTRHDYGYGEDGRLLWVDRNGARFADYRYDAQGRLTDVVRPDGPLSHAYDENGRLVRTLRGDASPFIYRWDGQHVVSAQCDREETRFHHDAHGRLTGLDQRVDAHELSVRFCFDARRAGSTGSCFRTGSRPIGFSWDARGRPAAIDWNGAIALRASAPTTPRACRGAKARTACARRPGASRATAVRCARC